MSDVGRDQRGQSLVEFALVVPLMLIIMLGVLDLARVYTTMMSVESGAREAADYGTTLGAGKWAPGPVADTTVSDMQQRACVATQQLTGYSDPDGDPKTGCANPTFTYCMTPPGGTCVAGPVAGCDDPLLPVPCTVTVSLHYRFDLIAPMGIDFFGVRLGLPGSLQFDRDSTFAMTDIDLTPGAP